MSVENEDARRTPQIEQEVRDIIVKEINSKIIDPFSLLAGLLASVQGEDENSLRDVGNLIGLMVRGSRKELDIQRLGGYGAYALQQMLDAAKPESARH